MKRLDNRLVGCLSVELSSPGQTLHLSGLWVSSANDAAVFCLKNPEPMSLILDQEENWTKDCTLWHS